MDVEIVLDAGDRTIEVPRDLAAALQAEPTVGAAFDRLAFTHRKEYVRRVEEAKRDETRKRRVGETVRMLREGLTRS